MKRLSIYFFNINSLLEHGLAKVGVHLILFYAYTLKAGEKGRSLPGSKKEISIRRETVQSDPEMVRLSIWEGEDEAGYVYMSNYPNGQFPMATYPFVAGNKYGYLDIEGTYLSNILVKKNYRSNGYAARLLANSISSGPNRGYFALTSFTNTPSRRLLDSFGFQRGDLFVYVNIWGRAWMSSSMKKRYRAP
jgi:ribosomal protein S18 acetylase RimI-like enzyme